MTPDGDANDSFSFTQRIARYLSVLVEPPRRGTLAALAAVSSALLLYSVYFLFAPWIWGTARAIVPGDLVPHMRMWIADRDGSEVFALYLLSLTTLVVAILIRRALEHDRPRSAELTFLALLTVATYLLLSRTGFSPPMAAPAAGQPLRVLILAVGVAVTAIARLGADRARIANGIVLLALLPVCFVSTQPFAVLDYSYIFAPALRLLHGFPLPEIYFQYDLLPSLLAALWMRLGIDLNLFQVLGQASYFLLLAGLLLFSQRFLIRKDLSYYLVASVVFVRMYALIADATYLLQVTPLRLDLWLVPLFVAHRRGISDRLLAVALAALIILDTTFGLVYVFSYLALLLTLLLLESTGDGSAIRDLPDIAKRLLVAHRANLSVLLAAAVTALVLFRGSALQAAAVYQGLGLGFMRITSTSFFWLVLPVMTLLFVLLVQNRDGLDERYFTSGLFLVFLTFGNCVYFFGRSHENNLLNTSAPLILALFLLLDLVNRGAERSGVGFAGKAARLVAAALPIVFVLGSTYFYSARILGRGQVQIDNLSRRQLVYPMLEKLDPSPIRTVTGDSEKVFFLTGNDFYYYFNGDYTPEARFSPFLAWVYMKDLVGYVQGLLEKDYFVIVPTAELGGLNEIVAALRSAHSTETAGFTVLRK